MGGELIIAAIASVGAIVSAIVGASGAVRRDLSVLRQENHADHLRNLERISEIKLAVSEVDSKIDQHQAWHDGAERNTA